MNFIKSNTGFEYEDIEQIGMIGLLCARRRFNSELNYKFSTFAYYIIKGFIQNELRDNQNIGFIRAVKYLIIKLRVNDDLLLSINEIICKYRVDYQTAVEALFSAKCISYLEDSIGKDKNGKKLILEDSIGIVSFEDYIIRKFTKDDFMDTLSSRERRVFNMINYGVSQNIIAKKLRVTQPTISRIFSDILIKAEKYGNKK